MIRRALVALFLVAAPSLARADASLPEPKGKGDWRGQCAERLERARDELAKRAPLLRRATVELRPLETDPGLVSNPAYDSVVLSGGGEAGITISVRPVALTPHDPAFPMPVTDDQRVISRLRAEREAVYYSSSWHLSVDGDARIAWSRGGSVLRAWLSMPKNTDRQVVEVLKRAVDECLSRATLK